MKSNHEKFMQECLELAREGVFKTIPNPSVGAVIVRDGVVIGKGATSPYGGPHAEINAINSVENKTLIKGASLYVTLEPCSHFGKTPPCCDKVIDLQFSEVIIGVTDPNSLVNGRGIEKMKKNGIAITTGVLEKECIESNKRFFTFHEKKRPYIILKWAQTSDGYIDKLRDKNEKGIAWITAPATQKISHRWRSQEMAICVGSNTVRVDNPSLTVRAVEGRNPVRIVLDKSLAFSKTRNVFNDQAKTIVFNELKDSEEGHIVYKKINFDDFLQSFLMELYQMNIMSVIIEGGKTLLTTFIAHNLWDEARVLVGEKKFNEGVLAPVIEGDYTEYKPGLDKIKTYTNERLGRK